MVRTTVASVGSWFVRWGLACAPLAKRVRVMVKVRVRVRVRVRACLRAARVESVVCAAVSDLDAHARFKEAPPPIAPAEGIG
jgi:hypothetical protein